MWALVAHQGVHVFSLGKVEAQLAPGRRPPSTYVGQWLALAAEARAAAFKASNDSNRKGKVSETFLAAAAQDDRSEYIANGWIAALFRARLELQCAMQSG